MDRLRPSIQYDALQFFFPLANIDAAHCVQSPPATIPLLKRGPPLSSIHPPSRASLCSPVQLASLLPTLAESERNLQLRLSLKLRTQLAGASQLPPVPLRQE